MMALVLVGVLLLLLALGFPVAIAMSGASVVYLLLRGDIPLVVVAQRVTVGVDSFVLLAIPFFFLAGELMNQGGITKRLVDLAQALVGGTLFARAVYQDATDDLCRRPEEMRTVVEFDAMLFGQ